MSEKRSEMGECFYKPIFGIIAILLLMRLVFLMVEYQT